MPGQLMAAAALTSSDGETSLEVKVGETVRRLDGILFVLLTIRLLLPPGICVCQWHSPAARFIVGLLNTGKEVPPPPPPEKEDDHEPGCPASKLAAGMGLRPASQPPLPPTASLEIVALIAPLPFHAAARSEGGLLARRPPDPDICLKVCALLI
jgi:hypothetical protein